MTTILIAGAGKSSYYLIQYLLAEAATYNWRVVVADGDAQAIQEKIAGYPNAVAKPIDITNAAERTPLVQDAHLVVSLMPPHLHIHLAVDCLKYKKNLITSSYISDELKAMQTDIEQAGLFFMCEMGLDPGIDHMSASKIIHEIHDKGCSIKSFKSYCGGLIAPESDDNPWHYKFSWNPKNIVNAGKGGAKYLLNGAPVEIPYHKIFDHNEEINIEGLAPLAYYANRDSLSYLDKYHLPEIATFLRATLRYPDFCKGWQCLIDLGLTDNEDAFDTTGLTHADWMMAKTGCPSKENLIVHVSQKLQLPPNHPNMTLLIWLGLFEDAPIRNGKCSSADILLDVLLAKWQMKPHEKDMVVMQHEFEYMLNSQAQTLISTMVLEGESRDKSAMAKTVGLPMGILAKLLLLGQLNPPAGLHIPTMPEVYTPVLAELSSLGIDFKEVLR